MHNTASGEISGAIQPENGSFRDRQSRVFYNNQRVFRALSQEALQDWQMLSQTQFFNTMVAEHKIVRSAQVAHQGILRPLLAQAPQAVIEHQTIPLISYPYEWSFGMLKDAALLHLELIRMALAEDMILKDASAYNVQWQGVSPTFIDITSFTKLSPGSPWAGYRQFCQMFLYPLFLQAQKGLHFQPWLRGSLEGIEPLNFCRLLSWADFLQPGMFVHGYLQAKVQQKFSDTLSTDSTKGIRLSSDLMDAKYGKSTILAMITGLETVIRGLTWKEATVWTAYADHNSYVCEEVHEKEAFVRQALQALPTLNQVWDMGANTGNYSRIAAEHAKYVLALDSDHAAVDKLYQSLKAEGKVSNILPLVYNLADPSPGLGWRGQERKPLEERGQPDLILCLALIHHLVIHHNIPMEELVRWLAGFGCPLVIEFVSKKDPMVQRLLSCKSDQYWDYEQDYFERLLSEAMEIRESLPLSQGTRNLYLAVPKA